MADETAKKPPVPEMVCKYEPAPRVAQQLERAFTYHAPKGDQQVRYIGIRAAAQALAHLVARATPESREQSLALTHIEEAVMWANAAIARNE